VRTFRCKACGRVAAAKDVAELLPHADGRNVPFASTRACFHKHFQDVTDVPPQEPKEETWMDRSRFL
jgi:hypothetical protein